MRGRRSAVSVAVVASLFGSAAPADAATTMHITVYDDLSACASVHSDAPATLGGSFAAAGAVTGPGTAVAPVVGFKPVTGGAGWYGCVAGAYAGASSGTATYVLSWSTADASGTVARVCTVRNGAVTCR